MLDYLAIGHVAQDMTPQGIRLGGTVAYAGLTARNLGLRVGVATAAAADARLDGLEGVALSFLPSSHSTTFENQYGPQGRRQIIHAAAGPITAEAIPDDWRHTPIVHLAPIAGEVDPALADLFPTSLVGLTPQGWMRRWDDAGRVTCGGWEAAERLLATATATVISIQDVAGDWALVEGWAAQANVFVATEGENGATVFWNGARRHFPAPAVPLVDPTGAGDIFAAAYFVRLWQTRDAWDAAAFAVSLASDSVTRAGIEGVPKASPQRDA